MGSISCHITPLVVISLGAYAHIHTEFPDKSNFKKKTGVRQLKIAVDKFKVHIIVAVCYSIVYSYILNVNY